MSIFVQFICFGNPLRSVVVRHSGTKQLPPSLTTTISALKFIRPNRSSTFVVTAFTGGPSRTLISQPKPMNIIVVLQLDYDHYLSLLFHCELKFNIIQWWRRRAGDKQNASLCLLQMLNCSLTIARRCSLTLAEVFRPRWRWQSHLHLLYAGFNCLLLSLFSGSLEMKSRVTPEITLIFIQLKTINFELVNSPALLFIIKGKYFQRINS